MVGASKQRLQARNKAASRQTNKLTAFKKAQGLKSTNKQPSRSNEGYNTQPFRNTVGKKQSTKKKQASQPVDLESDTSIESSDDEEQIKRLERVSYDDDKELSDNESYNNEDEEDKVLYEAQVPKYQQIKHLIDHPVAQTFMKTASLAGYANNEAEEKKTIDAIIKVKFWSKIKFLTNDSVLYCTGKDSLMEQVASALSSNNHKVDIETWWIRNRDAVRNTITKKRNNTTNLLKHIFLGKFIAS